MTLEYKHLNITALSAILFMSIYHLSSQIVYGSFLISLIFLLQSALVTIALLAVKQTKKSHQKLTLTALLISDLSLFILMLTQLNSVVLISTWFCVFLFCSAFLLPHAQALVVNSTTLFLYWACLVLITDNTYQFIESALALSLITLIVSVLSQIIHNLNQKLAISKNTDPVTGCMQSEAFTCELEKAKQLFDRYNTPFSLIIIEYKASFASETELQTWLKELAQLYQSRLRKTDMLCRLSSQQFIALLPSTDQKSAEILCSDLQKCADAYSFSYSKSTSQQNSCTQLSFNTKTYSEKDTLADWLKA